MKLESSIEALSMQNFVQMLFVVSKSYSVRLLPFQSNLHSGRRLRWRKCSAKMSTRTEAENLHIYSHTFTRTYRSNSQQIQEDLMDSAYKPNKTKTHMFLASCTCQKEKQEATNFFGCWEGNCKRVLVSVSFFCLCFDITQYKMKTAGFVAWTSGLLKPKTI